MKKADLARRLAKRSGVSPAEAADRLDLVVNGILTHLRHGQKALLPGLGTFTAGKQWVEQGTAPEQIVATRYKTGNNPANGVEKTRPLCAYPKVATYSGTGSTNEAANFSCEAPGKK